LEKAFESEVDWNYSEHGKLWAYHLNYFDYLHQDRMDWQTGKKLIDSFLEYPQERFEGLEPYPISIRTVNWIKFLAQNDQYPQEIIDTLYAQYVVLSKKLEYHLLGNHILENGFSLLFGAVFFQDEKLLQLTRKILKTELEEQVLKDGGHFELSPMYHLIILQRALDGYNLLKNNKHELVDIEEKLKQVIQRMVNWLVKLVFKSGDIPMFNDSTGDQALKANEIIKYAEQLGFKPQEIKLSDSGYRKFEFGDFELAIDVGNVGPTYQPGHAHSDTLNFVLYYIGVPVFVDRGISTYEKNKVRDEERCTASHNTVMINNTEQSDVWGGFRVGRRAQAATLKDSDNYYEAAHTGYEYLGIKHSRKWVFGENSLTIEDTISPVANYADSFLHFHPDINVQKLEEGLYQVGKLHLKFDGYIDSELSDYEYCQGFNKMKTAKKLTVSFRKSLKMTISE